MNLLVNINEIIDALLFYKEDEVNNLYEDKLVNYVKKYTDYKDYSLSNFDFINKNYYCEIMDLCINKEDDILL
mgnify:CR=1 FL=1